MNNKKIITVIVTLIMVMSGLSFIYSVSSVNNDNNQKLNYPVNNNNVVTYTEKNNNIILPNNYTSMTQYNLSDMSYKFFSLPYYSGDCFINSTFNNLSYNGFNGVVKNYIYTDNNYLYVELNNNTIFKYEVSYGLNFIGYYYNFTPSYMAFNSSSNNVYVMDCNYIVNLSNINYNVNGSLNNVNSIKLNNNIDIVNMLSIPDFNFVLIENNNKYMNLSYNYGNNITHNLLLEYDGGSDLNTTHINYSVNNKYLFVTCEFQGDIQVIYIISLSNPFTLLNHYDFSYLTIIQTTPYYNSDNGFIYKDKSNQLYYYNYEIANNKGYYLNVTQNFNLSSMNRVSNVLLFFNGNYISYWHIINGIIDSDNMTLVYMQSYYINNTNSFIFVANHFKNNPIFILNNNDIQTAYTTQFTGYYPNKLAYVINPGGFQSIRPITSTDNEWHTPVIIYLNSFMDLSVYFINNNTAINLTKWIWLSNNPYDDIGNFAVTTYMQPVFYTNGSIDYIIATSSLLSNGSYGLYFEYYFFSNNTLKLIKANINFNPCYDNVSHVYYYVAYTISYSGLIYYSNVTFQSPKNINYYSVDSSYTSNYVWVINDNGNVVYYGQGLASSDGQGNSLIPFYPSNSITSFEPYDIQIFTYLGNGQATVKNYTIGINFIKYYTNNNNPDYLTIVNSSLWIYSGLMTVLYNGNVQGLDIYQYIYYNPLNNTYYNQNSITTNPMTDNEPANVLQIMNNTFLIPGYNNHQYTSKEYGGLYNDYENGSYYKPLNNNINTFYLCDYAIHGKTEAIDILNPYYNSTGYTVSYNLSYGVNSNQFMEYHITNYNYTNFTITPAKSGYFYGQKPAFNVNVNNLNSGYQYILFNIYYAPNGSSVLDKTVIPNVLGLYHSVLSVSGLYLTGNITIKSFIQVYYGKSLLLTSTPVYNTFTLVKYIPPSYSVFIYEKGLSKNSYFNLTFNGIKYSVYNSNLIIIGLNNTSMPYTILFSMNSNYTTTTPEIQSSYYGNATYTVIFSHYTNSYSGILNYNVLYFIIILGLIVFSFGFIIYVKKYGMGGLIGKFKK